MSRDIPEPDFSFQSLSGQYRDMCKEFENIKQPTITISEILEVLPTLCARFVAIKFMLQYYKPTLGAQEQNFIVAIHNLINQTITTVQNKEEESGHMLDLLQPLKQQLIATESELALSLHKKD